MKNIKNFFAFVVIALASTFTYSADYTYDFSVQTTANPFTLPGPISASYNNWQVVNGSGAKIGSYGPTGQSWAVHNVTYGTTITSEITLGNAALSGDNVGAAIIIRSGTNAAAGYIALADSSGITIQRLTSAGALSSLTGAGGVTWATNDVIKLVYNTSTGALAASRNGVQLTSTTDTTFTSGERALMGAGFYNEWGNSNGQYIKVFAGTGVAASGVTLSPAAASLALTPATPTTTRQTFTWYALPTPGGYDNNSILTGQTYPAGSYLRVVTDFAHITAFYVTGPLQNDINDYATPEAGYTGSDSATYEIKSLPNTTSQYTITANINNSAVIGFSKGSLNLVGATPTIAQGKYMAPTAASLALTPATPSLVVGNNITVAPVAASEVLTGATPPLVVGGNKVVAPASAALALIGATPSINAGGSKTFAPGPALLQLAAATPSIIISNNSSFKPWYRPHNNRTR